MSSRQVVRAGASLLSDIAGYWQFAWRLRDYLRHRLTLDEARAIIRQRIDERDDNFLGSAERLIFGHPQSPYLPLLKAAGCGLGDLRDLVRARGLEGALEALRRAGVYLTYEEFKGRTPIVRNGLELHTDPRDFDNPHIHRDLEARSGGSTGRPTPVPIDMERIAMEAAPYMLAFHAHGILGVPTLFWRGILPDTTGISNILRAARFGHVTTRWFTPITNRDVRPPLRKRFATHAFVAMGRLWGAPIPWPEPLPLDHAAVLARSAAHLLKRHGACLIRCPVSLALRVSVAAQDEGLNLVGATFLSGGEPPTPAKVQAILRCGAGFIPNYAFTEAGFVGIGCGRPVAPDDTHLFRDAFAIIQHPRRVPEAAMSVDAFHFTSLTPYASKILLNVETDDYGILERRACGCPLGEHGLTDHLREIRSFAKLTTEGEAILGSDMIRIIEEILPARFGGSALDYQFVEEEDAGGLTRLTLLVSPRIDLRDEAAVISAVLNALPDRGARAVWRQANTLRVQRAAPVWTDRGKLRPLRTVRHQASGTNPDPAAPATNP